MIGEILSNQKYSLIINLSDCQFNSVHPPPRPLHLSGLKLLFGKIKPMSPPPPKIIVWLSLGVFFHPSTFDIWIGYDESNPSLLYTCNLM